MVNIENTDITLKLYKRVPERAQSIFRVEIAHWQLVFVQIKYFVYFPTKIISKLGVFHTYQNIWEATIGLLT